MVMLMLCKSFLDRILIQIIISVDSVPQPVQIDQGNHQEASNDEGNKKFVVNTLHIKIYQRYSLIHELRY